jgi:hypothetical protein
MSGLDVLIMRYDDALADPTGWSDQVGSWLVEHSLIGCPNRVAASMRVTVASRHWWQVDDDCMTDQQWELWELLNTLVGVHQRFSSPSLSVESPSTDRILRWHSSTRSTTDGGE